MTRLAYGKIWRINFKIQFTIDILVSKTIKQFMLSEQQLSDYYGLVAKGSPLCGNQHEKLLQPLLSSSVHTVETTTRRVERLFLDYYTQIRHPASDSRLHFRHLNDAEKFLVWLRFIEPVLNSVFAHQVVQLINSHFPISECQYTHSPIMLRAFFTENSSLRDAYKIPRHHGAKIIPDTIQEKHHIFSRGS